MYPCPASRAQYRAAASCCAVARRPATDSFHLDNAVFSKLTATGALNANYFHAGAAAADGNDYIVYNSANGALY